MTHNVLRVLILENLSVMKLQLPPAKVVTFYFYRAGHALAHEDHCRSDSQIGFLLVRTLPRVKICALSLFPLKKIKWKEKMKIREGMEIPENSHNVLVFNLLPGRKIS